jgi:hypothetical protein
MALTERGLEQDEIGETLLRAGFIVDIRGNPAVGVKYIQPVTNADSAAKSRWLSEGGEIPSLKMACNCMRTAALWDRSEEPAIPNERASRIE